MAERQRARKPAEPTHADLHRFIASQFSEMRAAQDAANVRLHERCDTITDGLSHVRQEACRQAEAISHLGMETERNRGALGKIETRLESGFASANARLAKLEMPVIGGRAILWFVGGIAGLLAASGGIIWTGIQIFKTTRGG